MVGLIGMKGRLQLSILHGREVVDQRESPNIMCTAGLNTLAQVITWTGIVDQNAAMGSPFSYTDLTPLYGALGTGTTAPAETDTQLTTEVTRAVVALAAVVASPPEFVWQFFFPVSTGQQTWSEAGVFLQASSAVNSGALLDHALFSPAIVQPAGDGALLQAVFELVNG